MWKFIYFNDSLNFVSRTGANMSILSLKSVKSVLLMMTDVNNNSVTETNRIETNKSESSNGDSNSNKSGMWDSNANKKAQSKSQ